MTAKDLKNALLQEAVQGKLVPQIASEGNARDLLEEIRKEKAKLIEEKKLKKEKPLPEITEDEIPFDIPENWCWCRLGEVVKNVNYGTSAKSHPTGKIPVLRMGNITKDGKLSFDNLVYTSDATEIQTYKLNAGDILFNRTNSAEWVGKTAVYKGEQPAIFAGYIIRYTPIFINSDYVNAVMNTSYQKKWCSEVKTNGVQQCNINAQNLMKFIFPLPPLAEQKRIVAAIEKFMLLIEEYGKKEAELTALNADIAKTLKNAILQEAVQGKLAPQIASEGNATDLLEEIKKEKKSHGFAASYGISDDKKSNSSDLRSKSQICVTKEKLLPEITEDEIPFDIPENWCWCRLGEIISYKMGKTPPRAESEWWEGNESIPWVSIADMIPDAKISLTKERLSKKAIKEYFGNNLSMKGTLLMSFKLTVGRVSILDIDAVHNEAIISIYPFVNKNDITRDYLFKVLPLLSNYGETKDAIKGKTLNSTSLSNMLIPLPPLAEQKRIVEAIEKMLPLCEKLG